MTRSRTTRSSAVLTDLSKTKLCSRRSRKSAACCNSPLTWGQVRARLRGVLALVSRWAWLHGLCPQQSPERNDRARRTSRTYSRGQLPLLIHSQCCISLTVPSIPLWPWWTPPRPPSSAGIVPLASLPLRRLIHCANELLSCRPPQLSQSYGTLGNVGWSPP